MPAAKTNGKVAGIGSDAVRKATGKDWKQWFALLDKAGARKMPHKEIARLLSTKYKVGPWWGQMVTVGYEQARGLRRKHEKPGGYEISASKTIAVPLSTLFKSWKDERARRRWLAGKITVCKATPNKSLHATWPDQTRFEVNFYAKGNGKSMVSVQHGKLPDAQAAARMKAYWKQALNRLQSTLTTDR